MHSKGLESAQRFASRAFAQSVLLLRRRDPSLTRVPASGLRPPAQDRPFEADAFSRPLSTGPFKEEGIQPRGANIPLTQKTHAQTTETSYHHNALT